MLFPGQLSTDVKGETFPDVSGKLKLVLSCISISSEIDRKFTENLELHSRTQFFLIHQKIKKWYYLTIGRSRNKIRTKTFVFSEKTVDQPTNYVPINQV